MSLATIIATVETDFTELEVWLVTEAETAASDLLALGSHVAQAIEPALFTALQDGVAAALNALGTGANMGELFTSVLNTLGPELGAIARTVETNLLSGIVSLLASKTAASVAMPVVPAA